MINNNLGEGFVPPSPHPSYLIFVDMYRERKLNEEWPEEWSYRANCVNWNDSREQVYATGQEAFSRAIAIQLQEIKDFTLSRKSCKAVTACIRSYSNHSEQIALPDDNKLAELEVLIRKEIEKKKERISDPRPQKSLV